MKGYAVKIPPGHKVALQTLSDTRLLFLNKEPEFVIHYATEANVPVDHVPHDLKRKRRRISILIK